MSSITSAYTEPECMQLLSPMSHPTPMLGSYEESLFLKDLPTYAQEFIILRRTAIKTILSKQYDLQLADPGREYVLLSHVPATIVDSEIDNRRLFGKGTRIFYHEDIRKLILKLPSRPHYLAITRMNKLIERHRSAIGLDEQLDSILSSSVSDPPYKKEPDGSWIPASLPAGRTDKWPSMILEVGYSESLKRLRVDAAWWLCRSKGEVKIAIIMSINTQKPHIIIEQFKPDLNTAALRDGPHIRNYPRVIPKCVQNLEIMASTGNVAVTGAPLVLRFSDIFLRQPQTQQETDLLISQQDLTAMAVKIWKWQKWPSFS